MSIVRIHISVRQMCVMCVELWRVEESSFPSTPHSLPSQAVLAAVMYYKPVTYITCSFCTLVNFLPKCCSLWHSIIKLVPLEGNLSGHPKSLVYDYLASSWHSEPAFQEGKPSPTKPSSSSLKIRASSRWSSERIQQPSDWSHTGQSTIVLNRLKTVVFVKQKVFL